MTLKISKAQKTMFRAIAVRKFEQTMIVHLQSLAPEHTKAMGEESLLLFIHSARKEALSFGIKQKETTRIWLELSMLWGIDFPNDPQFSFARKILDQERDELLRMRSLHRKAQAFILSSNGSGPNYFQNALKRAALLDFSDKLHKTASNDTEISQFLATLWPEKHKAVGSADMLRLVEASHIRATSHQLDAGAGPIIYSILAFFIGVGCITDPQFPWLTKSLGVSGQEAVEKLYERSHIYLKAVLNNA